MTTTPEQLEQFIGQMKNHSAYQQNQQVRELVDHYSVLIKKPEVQAHGPDFILSTLKVKLQTILEEIAAAPQAAASPDTAPLEPWPDPATALPDTHEELLLDLHLEKQYRVQRNIYEHLRARNLLPIGLRHVNWVPTLEVNNKDIWIPDWDKVREILQKNRGLVKEKSAQGFRKLLIVPFAASLSDMVRVLKELLQELDSNKLIFNNRKDDVIFNKTIAEWPLASAEHWNDPQLLYKCTFSVKGEIHTGELRRKNEIINLYGPWQIHLVEDRPTLEDGFPEPNQEDSAKYGIPSRAKRGIKLGIKGKTAVGDLMDFFEKSLLADKAYRHERLMHPETYLWMQLTSLLESPNPLLLDHIANHINSGTHLGAMSPEHNLVLSAGWATNGHLSLSAFSPQSIIHNYGIRTDVPLK